MTRRIARILLPPIALYFLLAASPAIEGQTKQITAAEAKNHIGEREKVCGKVATARYASNAKGQPTFLNLDEPYPKQVFTVLIWGSDRSKFGQPESEYRDKRVCVTGKITSYRGAPEIVVIDPGQVQFEK